MPKLSSLRRAGAEATRTARRFPLAIVAAGLGATTGTIAVSTWSWTAPLVRATMVAALGVSLFTALHLFAERRLTPARAATVLVAAAVGLAGFYAVWQGLADQADSLRYIQIALGLHLLVAFLPFAGTSESRGFWQYNRLLFQRALVSALFSGVLIVGLWIALLAVDKLLGIHVGGNNYPRLALLILFLFNTWFFLAGVPADLASLEERTDYPLGIKVFTQFILVPLVTVYLAILTLYLGKVPATRQWPSGWIGYLVSSVAVTGLLALLLVHPIREQTENRWVTTYARWFHLALLPSVAMLLAAAWKRIQQYGVTEPRYFLVVLAFWLAAIAIHQTRTRSGGIRLIPVSLCILAFATLVGPWSAYAVSRASQVHRLAALLEANHLPAAGAGPASGVSLEDRREISAIVRYLLASHDTVGWSHLLGADRVAAVDTFSVGRRNRYGVGVRARAILEAAGVAYVGPWEIRPSQRFSLNVAPAFDAADIGGMDAAVTGVGMPPFGVEIRDRMVTFSFDRDGQVLVLTSAADTLLAWPLTPAVTRLQQEYVQNSPHQLVPAERMTFREENERIRFEVRFQWIMGEVKGRVPVVDQFQATYYLGFK